MFQLSSLELGAGYSNEGLQAMWETGGALQHLGLRSGEKLSGYPRTSSGATRQPYVNHGWHTIHLAISKIKIQNEIINEISWLGLPMLGLPFSTMGNFTTSCHVSLQRSAQVWSSITSVRHRGGRGVASIVDGYGGTANPRVSDVLGIVDPWSVD